MRIESLRIEEKGDRRRIAATAVWEDSNRPSQELYFETTAEFAEGLAADPQAFVVAAIVPALWQGERRLLVEQEICPELRVGLTTVMSFFKHWYRLDHDLVRIETSATPGTERSRTPERSGFFFTGGIDSLATLCANRLTYPLQHPGSLKDGIIVYGLEVDKPEAFDYVLRSLTAIARETGISLIPVFTNIRYLNDDWTFWYNAYMGAALCAVAHALRRRLTVVSIASDYDIPHLAPHGTHPLLEPNFSSFDLKIRYDGITLSRFEKTKLVANCDVALQNIRVCNKAESYKPDMLNCGECEKCIRTMLTLVALDSLRKTKAFPSSDLSEKVINSRITLNEKISMFYEELKEPLRKIGREDLVKAIEYAEEIKRGEVGWKGPIKRFDRKYMGSNLVKLKRTFQKMT